MQTEIKSEHSKEEPNDQFKSYINKCIYQHSEYTSYTIMFTILYSYSPDLGHYLDKESYSHMLSKK